IQFGNPRFECGDHVADRPVTARWPRGQGLVLDLLIAPSVSLRQRDGKLRFKLFVDRLVVEDNDVSILVWLASGVGERMDRSRHPAGHHPVARGALSLLRWP